MYKNQFNVYQCIVLKYCFHIKKQSLFSIFLIAASYTFSGSIFFFPSPTMGLRFVHILVRPALYVLVVLFYLFCFVLKFANETLLNKYQRQGLRLQLSFIRQDVSSLHPFFTPSAFFKIYMSVSTTPQHIPIYVYWQKICSLLEPRYPEKNCWYFQTFKNHRFVIFYRELIWKPIQESPQSYWE